MSDRRTETQANGSEARDDDREQLKLERRAPVGGAAAVLRISADLLETIETLAAKANQGGLERVKPRDVVLAGVSKLTPDDLSRLYERKLTAQDRFDRDFIVFQKNHPAGTRDDFLNHLLSGRKPSEQMQPGA